ncbi:efflux transporter outer membrane subunit [Endozoicomonas sp. SM1973]|uniref:Efflux transporter outer membrane subunit n=1 Tax=Spartinivicinus marinus TaxID=2994442 RepID=A0A853I9K6_9GAMM|nr:efflux transporter outer membrane subunit [Spartinivicinus marinus]MCX4026247.1 efflux transporter outer membrane subunit [Spartinivicinus marinus]NYZ67338.1 efflux transporter outer membrane subunit [Spartinivicinus marinus]
MKPLQKIGLLIPVLTMAGCVSLAPDYQRPDSPVMAEWRDTQAAQQNSSAVATNKVMAAIKWQDYFQDPKLRQVINLALTNNRDLRIALLNIEQARAKYGIQEATLWPSISVSSSKTASRTPASVNGGDSATISHQYEAGIGFSSYELDLFGRISSLKDEALESYLSTVETQRSTRLSLIAEVANNWLTLATNLQLQALARQTLNSQLETLKLTQKMYNQGIASKLNLAQVQSSVETARVDVATYKAQVAQDRNALELVVGTQLKDNLLPTVKLEKTIALAPIPANLKSSVLLQRPDVLAAEHSLQGANANIGAARAAFFPTISLTASAGRSSNQLNDLFSSSNRNWSFTPSISLPIFNAGSLSASLKESKVRRDIAVAEYEKTIQIAFKEVADVLSVRASLDERLKAQKALVKANSQSYTLSNARYRNGLDSYLDALDSQRQLYSAQQALIQLQLTEYSNRVTLFKVLGGGTEA